MTKDEKSTDKKYVYDRVFNPDENNTIVYKGKLQANSRQWSDANMDPQHKLGTHNGISHRWHYTYFLLQILEKRSLMLQCKDLTLQYLHMDKQHQGKLTP